MEDNSPATLEKFSGLIEYARAHNIEVGGYDLIDEKSPTAAEEQYATVDPVTNKAGGSLCFASGWRRGLTNYVLTWVEGHNLTAVETDGPYGGANNASFAPFDTKNDHFTKTGSGQT